MKFLILADFIIIDQEGGSGDVTCGHIKYVPFMWAAKVKRILYVIPISEGYFRVMYDQTSECTIVTTDHDGMKDIVKEEFAMFVEKQNPNSIAKGIEDAYKNFETISFKAWKEAKSKYTQKQFVNRVMEVLPKCSKG